MDIVFMGTPDFAAGILKSIYEAGHNVLLVVTQPDKPKGRGKEMAVSAVKAYAESVNLPVFQPERIKSEEAVGKLREYKADVFVVAAFGQILSKEILDMPRSGCINVHASLLPKYRGASPIQWAIMEGEKVSGVTIMYMNEGLDTGDMLLKKEVIIEDNDTGESLHDKLMEAGEALILTSLEDIKKGNINPIKQIDEESSYAKLLTKQMGELDFNKDAASLERLIRAFTPWPGTYTFINGKMLKVLEAAIIKDDSDAVNGCVYSADKNGIKIKCQKDSLLVTRVQLEGKKKMDVRDFLLGYEINSGTVLGR